MSASTSPSHSGSSEGLGSPQMIDGADSGSSEGSGQMIDATDSGSRQGSGSPQMIDGADSGSSEGSGSTQMIDCADSGSSEGSGQMIDGADSGSSEGSGSPQMINATDSGSRQGSGSTQMIDDADSGSSEGSGSTQMIYVIDSGSSEGSASPQIYLIPIEDDSDAPLIYSCASTSSSWQEKIRYVEVRRDHCTEDEYHGLLINDPYRWLEGGSDQTQDEVKLFIAKQQAHMEIVKSACHREEDILRKASQFLKAGHHIYTDIVRKKGTDDYFVTDGSKIFLRKAIPPKEMQEVKELEFNCSDGLIDIDFSPDGKFAVLFFLKDIEYQSSEWRSLQILNLETRKVYPEHLKQGIFSDSVSWIPGDSGFLYRRHPPTFSGAIYYHHFGKEQDDDVVLWEDSCHQEYIADPTVTEDGTYLVLRITQGGPFNMLYFLELSEYIDKGFECINGKFPFKMLVDDFDDVHSLVSNTNTSFLLITSRGAPMNKLVSVDLNNCKKRIDVLSEKSDLLTSAYPVSNDRVLASYFRDGMYFLQVWKLGDDHMIHQLFQGIGSPNFIYFSDDIYFFQWSDFTTDEIYCLNLQEDSPNITSFQENLHVQVTPLEVRQVFFEGNDGTLIPMTIVHQSGIKLNNSNPCLLHIYGGFAEMETISFDCYATTLVKDFRFVCCFPHIRGGGEGGRNWYLMGQRLKKQTSIDDIIAASMYLQNKGYTNSEKLCIEGSSHGGTLVAACVNQRPELFGCALIRSALTDMLRYHASGFGPATQFEFGISNVRADFECLIRYSPLHNVKVQSYPPMLLYTGLQDERCPSFHTFKLLAELQYNALLRKKRGFKVNPVIGFINENGGHDDSEQCFCYAFMLKVMDVA